MPGLKSVVDNMLGWIFSTGARVGWCLSMLHLFFHSDHHAKSSWVHSHGNIGSHFCTNNLSDSHMIARCGIYFRNGTWNSSDIDRSWLKVAIAYLFRLSVAIKSKWHPQAMITAENYLDKLKVSNCKSYQNHHNHDNHHKPQNHLDHDNYHKP